MIIQEELKMTGIYKITNLINNQIYIGQARDLSRRIYEHKYRSFKENTSDYNSAIGTAIREYGLDNFNIEIIENCSIEELDEKERYWIKYYNSYYEGYNRTLGGRSGILQPSNPVYQYEWTGKFIKEYIHIYAAVENTGISITSIQGCLRGDQNIAGGYQWSYKKYNFIEPYYTDIPVICYDLQGNKIKDYSSISSAAKETGDTSESIKKSCKTEDKTGKNYQWRYWEQYNDIDKIDSHKKQREHAINQYDLNGNFIRTFNSITEAVQILNKNIGSSIARCCKHEDKYYTAGGFIWSYYGEEPYIPKKIKVPIKIIQQYDLDNNLIAEFSSEREAVEKVFKSLGYRKTLHKCLIGERKNPYHNYIWKYKENNNE